MKHCHTQHLIEAVQAFEFYLDALAAMVVHLGLEPDCEEWEEFFDKAVEFVHGDAVSAAVQLPARARRARLNALWRQWESEGEHLLSEKGESNERTNPAKSDSHSR